MTPKVTMGSGESRRIWVNFPISGEMAEIYLRLKERGIVNSTRDAFAQGLRCLHEKVVEMDLKQAKLKASQRLEEGYYRG